MAKRYSELVKRKVRNLRKNGWTLGEINRKLKIPKNTISGWVNDIQLSKKQKERIKEKIAASAELGRSMAVAAISRKMEAWKQGIRKKTRHFEQFPLQSPEIGKLICGILYLCEGGKYPSSRYLYFGNSNPRIVSAFISLLRRCYRIDEKKLRFDIRYRYDQNYEKLKAFWSKVTKIPKSKCLRSKPDLRTRGKPTLRKDYRGVGCVAYFSTDLQFELQSIGESVINSISG
jgi:hypothetical protein